MEVAAPAFAALRRRPAPRPAKAARRASCQLSCADSCRSMSSDDIAPNNAMARSSHVQCSSNNDAHVSGERFVSEELR